MLPFRTLNRRSRLVIALATFAYFLTLATMLVLARSAMASGPDLIESVSARALHDGGLFLATDEPGRLLPALNLSTHVEIIINGPVARVRVRQTFVNPDDRWLEGIYTFPLPDKSAVDRLTLIVGEKRIDGIIMVKGEALIIYQAARSAGQRASLVSQERPNIFTNRIANIGPGETIMVEIEYQQGLRFDNGFFSLRFPTVIRPRYIPGEIIAEEMKDGTGWSFNTDQVPDAGHITPPIADPYGDKINPVSITITLDAGFPIGQISSAFHDVVIEYEGASKAMIELDRSSVPADRDFVLEWRPAQGYEPTVGVFTETIGDYDHHLIFLMPPDDANLTVRAEVSIPREVIFILDVSGSMSGDAIKQAKAALGLAINRLTLEDRFNVISFSNEASMIFERPLYATDVNIAQATEIIDSLIADGGTEMAAALSLALDSAKDLDRIRQIIFITDGAVGNEAKLFQMINAGLGDSRLFTIGISSTPNSYFMSEAAEAGRGSYTYIGALDQVQEKMAGLFEKLENPVLSDLELELKGGIEALIYPVIIPDLYQGEPIVIAVRTPAGSVFRGRMVGQDGISEWSRSITHNSTGTADGIASIWARFKILDINRRARKEGSQWQEETIAEIVLVALAYKLVTDHTSLVAVDDEVVRPEDEALDRAVVGTNLPDGMDPDFAESAVLYKTQQNNIRVMTPSTSQSNQRLVNAPTFPAPLPLDMQSLQAEAEFALPQTATAAELRILVGLILLLISVAGFMWWRQRPAQI